MGATGNPPRTTFGLVGRVPARQSPQAGATEHDHVGHDTLEERTVVAHHDHRAREPLQIVLELAQGLGVQVVGRLVQHEHVRILREGAEQLQAAPLTTREGRHGSPLGIGVEPERLEEGVGAPVGFPPTRDHVAYPRIVGQLATQLVVDPHRDRRAVLDHTLTGFEAARHDVEQGRLARPVGSHDSESFTSVEQQLDILEQDLVGERLLGGRLLGGPRVTEALGHSVQLDDAVAEPWSSRVQRQLADPRLLLGSGVDDLSRRGDPRLRLRCACRCPTLQPFEFPARKVGPPGLAGLRVCCTSRLVLEIGGVPAVVDEATPTVQFHDPRADAVEEVAVVGDQEQRSTVSGQALLEPADGIDVEVVGRFVEHQHRCLRHQGASQVYPLGLAPGELLQRPLHLRSEAQTVGHRFDLPGLVAHSVVQRIAERRPGQLTRLLQYRDLDPRSAAHRARLGLPGAREHREQCGLAGAVDADDRDPVTIGDRQVEVLEQHPSGAAGRETLGIDQDHPVGARSPGIPAPEIRWSSQVFRSGCAASSAKMRWPMNPKVSDDE